MTLNNIPELRKPLTTAAMALNRAEPSWLVGGSCGLMLQGVRLDRAPRDIDIYADREDIWNLHRQLQPWADGEPALDKEGIYESIMGFYEIDGYSVELVGGFIVSSGQSVYRVEVEELLYPAAPKVECSSTAFRLMPLSHELVFNVLRERPDRYKAIAEAIKEEPELHCELLGTIVGRNEWDRQHLSLIGSLTGLKLP